MLHLPRTLLQSQVSRPSFHPDILPSSFPPVPSSVRQSCMQRQRRNTVFMFVCALEVCLLRECVTSSYEWCLCVPVVVGSLFLVTFCTVLHCDSSLCAALCHQPVYAFLGSPLHRAIQRVSIDVINALIAAGADISEVHVSLPPRVSRCWPITYARAVMLYLPLSPYNLKRREALPMEHSTHRQTR